MASVLGYQSIDTKIVNLPLLSPITQTILAGATVTVSFPSRFLGMATDVLIVNNDAAGVARYQINGPTNALQTLAAGRDRSFGGQQITQILITAGAGGTVELTANIILFGTR